MKSIGVILVLALIGYAVFSCSTLAGQMATQAGNERRLIIQATMENPRTFEDHSLDTAEEIAADGLKSVVAVAVSADVSQTAIARTLPDTIWGAAAFLFGLVALILVGKWAFSGGKGSSGSQAYITSDSFSERGK